MIKVSIIEDEILLSNQLKKYISELENYQVVSITSDVFSSIEAIEMHQPDLVLSDIKIIGGDAFDVLNALKEINFSFFFITAFNEYAIKAIKFGAIDYLLKPLDKEELFTALQKVKIQKDQNINTHSLAISTEQFKKGNVTKLTIKTSNMLYFLEIAEIVYCKGEGSYTTFVMQDGQKVMASKNIKEYEGLLPESSFIRPHQSYIVNAKFIQKMDTEGSLFLLGSTENIPVSTRRKEMVLQFFSNRS